MTAEFPLLMLPEPSEQDKGGRNGFGPSMHRPSVEAQGRRLAPKLTRLTNAFGSKKVKVQTNPDGMEPELALVFEVAGSLPSFFGAVKRIDGLDWLFDIEDDEMPPDEYFYSEEDADSSFSGRVYCVMSDRKAFDQLMGIWEKYQKDDEYVFPRGLTSLRDLFCLLRDVHAWGPEDRFLDTGILDHWRETVEVKGMSPSPFEIELFYRSSADKRRWASKSVRDAIKELGGNVLSECVIDEIRYHGMMATLPTQQIEELLGAERDNMLLARCDEVMYYRPGGQVAVDSVGDLFEEDIADKLGQESVSGAPILAVLDGLPLENHIALRNRLVIDDPDGFGENYPASLRLHGTAVASIVAHGDLAAPKLSSVSRPIYVRPIMQPDKAFGRKETFPEDILIVDLVHRAVKRIFDGDEGTPAAPSVRVINLSVGDEARQFLGRPSPLAKLLDWLSYKYRVLFVISTGNQRLDLIPIEGGLSELKELSIPDRAKRISNSLVRERRNLKLLSPAESLNSITVGALYDDHSHIVENSLSVQPVEEGDVSPITSFGSGITRSIKPEILYPGGKFLVSAGDENSINLARSGPRGPGILTAAPSAGLIANGYTAEAGTSCSAAAISHECEANYNALEEVFSNAGHSGVPQDYAALLLKAMTVHGCVYDSIGKMAEKQFSAKHKDCTQWVGYGYPDFQRARECALNRVTTFGFGDIGKDEGQKFRIPLPLNFSSEVIDRRLVVTLAYFAPIAFSRQEYRHAQLWFDRVGLTKERLVPNREYTDWQAIRRGTLQHQSFVGGGALSWDEETDEIEILVSCASASGLHSLGKLRVPYALLVTFETKQPINVYQPVANRLRIQEPVRPI